MCVTCISIRFFQLLFHQLKRNYRIIIFPFSLLRFLFLNKCSSVMTTFYMYSVAHLFASLYSKTIAKCSNMVMKFIYTLPHFEV